MCQECQFKVPECGARSFRGATHLRVWGGEVGDIQCHTAIESFGTGPSSMFWSRVNCENEIMSPLSASGEGGGGGGGGGGEGDEAH